MGEEKGRKVYISETLNFYVMISIPFVGVLRSDILEKNGFDLDRIKKSSPEDIAKLDGFSEKIAERIKRYAELVDKNYHVPEETVFDEFHCPRCGAIVSEIEYECHKCGHQFFKPPDDYDEKVDALARVIVKIYKEPDNPSFWREGEKILSDMLLESKASDFKFKASSIELELLEREAKEKWEKTEMVKVAYARERVSIKDMYKKSLTNGLVNGMGQRYKKPEKTRWTHVIFVLLILVAPIAFVAMMTTALSPPIIIDGNFSDWRNIREINVHSQFFTSFKVKIYDDTTYLYLSTARPLFQNTSKAYLILFIDYDGLSSTGFPINKIGADYILSIYGTEGSLNKFMAHSQDNSWKQYGNFDYAVRKNMCEIRTLKVSDNARFLLYYDDGTEHYSSIITLKPTLSVEYSGGKILNLGDTIERITLWNSYRGSMKIDSITLWNLGNSSANIKIKYGNLEKNVQIKPGNNTVQFNSPLIVNEPAEMSLIYEGGGKNYGTLKFRIHTNLPEIEYDKCEGSYIGNVPSTKKIDGIFLDWKNPESSKRVDLPGDVNIKKYEISKESTVNMYIDVYGMLMGLSPPRIGISGNHTHGNITHNKTLPRDTIEVFIDSDKNPSTGYKIVDIGADYRVLLMGNLGKIKEVKSYKWSGKWILTHLNVKMAKNYHSIEMDLGIGGNVYFRLVNWQGLWDKITTKLSFIYHGIVKNASKPASNSTHPVSKVLYPKLVGKYNVTEFRAIFGTDVQVTTSSYDESRPTITRTSDGTLWVTYDYAYTSTDHDIYFANSTDGGETWTVYSLDTTSYNLLNPVILSDSSDNIYIFFENDTSGSYFSYWEHNINEGNLWHIYTISTWNWWSDVHNISAATYTVGSDIYIYVFFEYAYTSTDYDVGFIKTTDGGSIWWDYHDNLATTGYWEGHPSVAISTGTNPEVFIAYQNYSSYNKWCVTVLNNTNINGTTWWGYYFESAYGNSLTDPSLAASGDYIYMVAQDEYQPTDHDIVLYNSTDNGLSWGGNWVNYSSDDEVYPNVVASGLNVYVFYLDASSGYIIEKDSADGGYSWSNFNKVSDVDSGVSIYHTVSSYYYNGNLYVVWTDNRNGNYDIYFDKVPELNVYPLIIVPIALATVFLRRKQR